MSEFHVKGILLDIEGTTSSIRFVYDEMFPFVRRELDAYLAAHWNSPELQAACDTIARDTGHASFAAWLGALPAATARSQLADHIHQLMDEDAKISGLKQLQGLVWRQGFESGELRAHVFPDVPPALHRWNQVGVDVRIYSSGSIAAQQLFFGHSIAGDLLRCFRGHYDTTTGGKQAAASYAAIADDFMLEPGCILFVSDIVGELAAAREAGLQTVLSLRPGNPEQPDSAAFPAIRGFDEIQLAN